MAFKFEKIPFELVDWNTIHNTDDSTIYKTKEWFSYLFLWKKIEPFIVKIDKENRTIGYFIGEIIKKGVRIIGSPFEGIGTAHQGLSMLINVSAQERLTIYRELSRWAFKNKYGIFMQVDDWQITMEDCANNDIRVQGVDGFMIDLTLSENKLFHNLHQKSCRYCINKSIKEGVAIRETNDVERFVSIYYDQLIEVFAKQGLTPTYNINCVKSLVNALYPDKILLLEAVSLEGEVLATGLFPGDQNLAIFWGGASYQKYQKKCPNEPLIWEAIKTWKNKGTKTFDLCGIRPYKLKFGPETYTKPRLYFAKYPILIPLKEFCKKSYYGFRSVMASFKNKK